jgi:hypothetical protein
MDHGAPPAVLAGEYLEDRSGLPEAAQTQRNRPVAPFSHAAMQ